MDGLMDDLIVVRLANVYGNINIYPVSDNARIMAEISNKKTFGYKELGLIKALGYRIEVWGDSTPLLLQLDSHTRSMLHSEAR